MTSKRNKLNETSTVSYGHKKQRKNDETKETIPVSNPSCDSALQMFGQRMGDDFYNVPCETLARGLLGQMLTRVMPDGALLRCKIVETECYLGGEDQASHSYNGRRTEGNKPMYMKPGTTYVYFTYGMYHCFNISSQGDGAAVLLRAGEPVSGMEFMQINRAAHKKSKAVLKYHELCNGPSKLCMSLAIERMTCNKQDLSTYDGMWIEKSPESETNDIKVVTSHRIGIERVGGEWAKKHLRFYILGNTSVSKRDKISEGKM